MSPTLLLCLLTAYCPTELEPLYYKSKETWIQGE